MKNKNSCRKKYCKSEWVSPELSVYYSSNFVNDIISSVPFFVPLDRRFEIFHNFIVSDKKYPSLFLSLPPFPSPLLSSFYPSSSFPSSPSLYPFSAFSFTVSSTNSLYICKTNVISKNECYYRNSKRTFKPTTPSYS